MTRAGDIFALSFDALRSHRLRSALTVLGLTMGVATLITVVTLVQGANVYVEQKVARLGSDVFQIARFPFATTDWRQIIRAQRHRRINRDDYRALRAACRDCRLTGASGQVRVRARRGDLEATDVDLIGQTASMAAIDSRTIVSGRFFSEPEEGRSLRVCLLGQTLVEKLFAGEEPVGRTLRLANQEFVVIGVFERIGSVLGQDGDNYAVAPLATFLAIRGARYSLTLNVRVAGDPPAFERAMDQARLLMRARHHLAPTQEEDFYVGTKDSYIALWQQISGAFFGVFILVSSISALVGGIVIMNVMLVSVTERTQEIGIRRAVGASGADIRRQFLTESVMQCLLGGLLGIGLGFACASLLREFTGFPAAVQTRVAALGVALSSSIGLFFGIYPASRAARLDPVEALRSE
jgi:putative ABC transport system permease protein